MNHGDQRIFFNWNHRLNHHKRNFKCIYQYFCQIISEFTNTLLKICIFMTRESVITLIVVNKTSVCLYKRISLVKVFSSGIV